jgi:hypothetical protein
MYSILHFVTVLRPDAAPRSLGGLGAGVGPAVAV